jgi:hypothetical protein
MEGLPKDVFVCALGRAYLFLYTAPEVFIRDAFTSKGDVFSVNYVDILILLAWDYLL